MTFSPALKSQSYSFSLDTRQLTNGSHVLKAKAYDARGNSVTVSRAVTVANPVQTALTVR